MSSSSDIDKLFEQFGGDANAYQEIGRENDARSARTRWPLLVKLDLTQPAIPAIGPLREAKPQPPVSVAPRAAVDENTTPKDVASVTRAKAPLFTRPHRRDIPPVPLAPAQPAAPSGASRFASAEEPDEAAVRAAAGGASAGPAAAPGAAASAPIPPSAAPAPSPAQAQAQTSVPPTAPAWLTSSASAIPPTVEPASPSSTFRFRAPAAQPVTPAAPAAPAYGSASTAPAPSMQPPPAPQPAYTTQPPSILGKVFATPQTRPAPPQAAATAPQATSLNSVFDRLRGTRAQGTQAPADNTRGAVPSWLTNGPRRP